MFTYIYICDCAVSSLRREILLWISLLKNKWEVWTISLLTKYKYSEVFDPFSNHKKAVWGFSWSSLLFLKLNRIMFWHFWVNCEKVDSELLQPSFEFPKLYRVVICYTGSPNHYNITNATNKLPRQIWKCVKT